ncbi:MAG: serine O-acetyltransferase [Alphaproteobacteria bacterium]|nr:serine O-acetyltransferase [Alphaproteobacteria bacterium]
MSTRANLFKQIRDEIDGMMSRDPAARSWVEVVLCYPGFHALVLHRVAHAAWRRGWRLAGRFISQIGRFFTGIEIHPGARIGKGLFIDHGMGVVIGETSQIGNNVTLYHGVTLGGIAPSVDSDTQRDRKRHPTLCDGVIVGSGAQILGPIEIGEDARIGANSVVVKEVPAGVTVTGIPSRVVMRRDKRGQHRFVAYGTPLSDLPDPMVRAIEDLRHEISVLQARLDAAEATSAAGDKAAAKDAQVGGEKAAS